MDTRIVNSCQRYFIETDEVNSKGKPKSMPIDVRKMRIYGDFIWTNEYEINVIKRKGKLLFCVKYKVKQRKGLWFEPEPPEKWKRDGSYDKAGFAEWLTRTFKVNGEQMVIDLLTCPPENLAAA